MRLLHPNKINLVAACRMACLKLASSTHAMSFQRLVCGLRGSSVCWRFWASTEHLAELPEA